MTDVTIIVVDGELELRKNLTELLEFKNYTVHAFQIAEG